MLKRTGATITCSKPLTVTEMWSYLTQSGINSDAYEEEAKAWHYVQQHGTLIEMYVWAATRDRPQLINSMRQIIPPESIEESNLGFGHGDSDEQEGVNETPKKKEKNKGATTPGTPATDPDTAEGLMGVAAALHRTANQEAESRAMVDLSTAQYTI